MKNNPFLEAFFESIDSNEDWLEKNGYYYNSNNITFSIVLSLYLELRIEYNNEIMYNFYFGVFKNRKIYKYYKKMKDNIKEKKYKKACEDLPIKIKRKLKLNQIND